MTMPGKGRAVLIVAIPGVLLMTILLSYLLYNNYKTANEWPVSLHEPLFIPTQVSFATRIENNQNPGAAEEAWKHALSGFRSASSDAAAIKQAAPLLRDIWTSWPNSDIAVRAQLFYLGTLEAYGSDEVGLEQSLAFLGRAFQSPRLYFSSEHQASAQFVATQVIQTLVEQSNDAQAWLLCVRLRWLAPRIDLIAPVCQGLIDESPHVALSPKLTLSLLSPLVPISKIPAEKLTLSLAKVLQHYLSHPYDVDALTKAIIELYKGGFKELSSEVLLELLEIDPMKVSKIEVAVDKLKAAEK